MVPLAGLRGLLQEVSQKVPFYQETVSRHIHDLQCNDEFLLNIFHEIPIIRKQDMKSNMEQFIDADIASQGLDAILNMDKDFKKEYIFTLPHTQIAVEYTSGSSGVPFASFKTLNERMSLGRSLWKLRNSIYTARPDHFFYFIHTFRDTLYPFPFEEPKVEKDKIVTELDYLDQSTSSWWHVNGYILDYYDSYLNSNEHAYRFNHLKVIENNGSFISTEDKARYSRTFSSVVVNNYGCREVWAIAYDCQEGHLHINDDSIYFELVDEQDQLIHEANQIGYVVVTSLKQKSMPFIRYKTGDFAYYLEGECTCNKKSRRIFVCPGRQMIAGTQIYGNKVFKDIISYVSLQFRLTNYHSISVLQEDYDHFAVNVKGMKEDKSRFESCFKEAAWFVTRNENYQFSFTYIDSLEPKSIFAVKMKNATH
ncbi:hypothetical protein [Paenibacillus sp. 1001270B_150601_E10]|uniref:hypothetical protein n=1 Tax=Paenibacillus sp. 1001270B_150601_E10 TaxID=2787079 RepID=UPI0018A057D3|nr:hypothetical protein [Paenibacillus sp. 1001270B_150601_E10]